MSPEISCAVGIFCCMGLCFHALSFPGIGLRAGEEEQEKGVSGLQQKKKANVIDTIDLEALRKQSQVQMDNRQSMPNQTPFAFTRNDSMGSISSLAAEARADPTDTAASYRQSASKVFEGRKQAPSPVQGEFSHQHGCNGWPASSSTTPYSRSATCPAKPQVSVTEYPSNQATQALGRQPQTPSSIGRGAFHLPTIINVSGMWPFGSKLENTFKAATAPARATFEIVTNFLVKLKEQSFELDSAEHGAILADEIVLSRKRSALISLFAVDIPFLTLRLIINWYMLIQGRAFDMPPFILKNVICILLQATQLKMAQQAGCQTASRWLQIGHQRRWVDQQMRVSHQIHQQSNFAGFDVAFQGGVVGLFGDRLSPTNSPRGSLAGRSRLSSISSQEPSLDAYMDRPERRMVKGPASLTREFEKQRTRYAIIK